MNEKEAYKKGLIMFKNHDELNKIRHRLGRFPSYEEAISLIERVLTEDELWDLGMHSTLLEVKVEKDEEGYEYKTYVRAVFEFKKERELMEKCVKLNRLMTYDEMKPYILGVSRKELQYNLHE